MFAKIL
jgi:hypothetical protein